MMTFSQMTELPSNLDARILYLCQTLTKTGHHQAKCVYLHEEQELKGIIFSPDNEDWFQNLQPGSIVKAERISLSSHPDYIGEYKGGAVPLTKQDSNLLLFEPNSTQYDKWEPWVGESKSIPIHHLPNILKEAANNIESLVLANYKMQKIVEELTDALALKTQASQIKQEEPKIKTVEVKVAAPFRNKQHWTDIIVEIITSNEKFLHNPFSGLTLNGYLDACFNDFWDGDLEKMSAGNKTRHPRWRPMVSGALSELLKCGFIERMPGYRKHYRITKETFVELSKP